MISQSIGRAQLQETAGGLRIVIPAKWSWCTFVGMPILGGFVLAVAWGGQLLDSRVTAGVIVVLILLTAVRKWLWNIGGKEIVTLSANTLIVRYGIFGVGWHCSYNLNGVSNFRFVPPIDGYRSHEHRTVAFDYEFMPRRFGLCLTAAEVDKLIAVIQGYIGSFQQAVKHA